MNPTWHLLLELFEPQLQNLIALLAATLTNPGANARDRQTRDGIYMHDENSNSGRSEIDRRQNLVAVLNVDPNGVQCSPARSMIFCYNLPNHNSSVPVHNNSGASDISCKRNSCLKDFDRKFRRP
jgi:hypothetical protein